MMVILDYSTITFVGLLLIFFIDRLSKFMMAVIADGMIYFVDLPCYPTDCIFDISDGSLSNVLICFPAHL